MLAYLDDGHVTSGTCEDYAHLVDPGFWNFPATLTALTWQYIDWVPIECLRFCGQAQDSRPWLARFLAVLGVPEGRIRSGATHITSRCSILGTYSYQHICYSFSLNMTFREPSKPLVDQHFHPINWFTTRAARPKLPGWDHAQLRSNLGCFSAPRGDSSKLWYFERRKWHRIWNETLRKKL